MFVDLNERSGWLSVSANTEGRLSGSGRGLLQTANRKPSEAVPSLRVAEIAARARIPTVQPKTQLPKKRPRPSLCASPSGLTGKLQVSTKCKGEAKEDAVCNWSEPDSDPPSLRGNMSNAITTHHPVGSNTQSHLALCSSADLPTIIPIRQ